MGTNEVHRWPEWETQLLPARAVLLQARPDGSLLALASGVHGARVLQLRPVQISESGFGSPLARVRLGGEMGWHVRGNARQRHGVWTLQALHLLPTVTYAPGQDVFWAFSAAGTYRLTDPSDGARARVEVPMRLTLSGRLQFGIGTSPGGLVYQVQMQRPSGRRFRPWLSTTDPRVDLPSAPGTYEFRARLVKLRTGEHTGWSPVRRVSVD
jgi:hypothetical protein